MVMTLFAILLNLGFSHLSAGVGLESIQLRRCRASDGGRSKPLLRKNSGSSEEIVGAFRRRQLAKRVIEGTRAGKRVGKSLGILKMRGHA
jgi:hypothetical protein